MNEEIKEAIKWLEEKKGIRVRNISNLKYVMIDEYTTLNSVFYNGFESDEELLRWVEELKREEEEAMRQ